LKGLCEETEVQLPTELDDHIVMYNWIEILNSSHHIVLCDPSIKIWMLDSINRYGVEITCWTSLITCHIYYSMKLLFINITSAVTNSS